MPRLAPPLRIAPKTRERRRLPAPDCALFVALCGVLFGMSEDDQEERVRLDKWLWAARFYKTRALASEAIGGGKVQVNGDRAKRARALQVGDDIRIRQGVYEYQVAVVALSARRGPASEAAG